MATILHKNFATARGPAAPAHSVTWLGLFSPSLHYAVLGLEMARLVRRGMLGACAASLFHGLVTATLATQQLWHWPIVVDAVNTPAENLTLQISTVPPPPPRLKATLAWPPARKCAQHEYDRADMPACITGWHCATEGSRALFRLCLRKRRLPCFQSSLHIS